MNEDILPNLLYCLKTGRYTDVDFNEEVAQEYGTSKEVAEMAAVKCCFNCKKTDILQDLISCHDFNKIELEAMAQAGIYEISKMSLTDIHEFFYNNRDIPFFRYCNDYLTSWDACSLVYRNDFPPSLLAQYADIVEQPEELVQAVLASIGKAEWNVEKKTTDHCIMNCVFAMTADREVRKFLKEHNYDFYLAQKKFNWTNETRRIRKYKMKKVLARIENVPMVREYPFIRGVPLIVKPHGKPSYFKCINIENKCKDLEKLMMRTYRIQRKAIFQYEKNVLNSMSISLINQEMAECCDTMLYLLVSGAENIIDYNKRWKERYKDTIVDKLEVMVQDGVEKDEEVSVWLFKDVISTMFLSNNIGKNLYKMNGWMDLLIDNNDNISISLINRRKEI